MPEHPVRVGDRTALAVMLALGQIDEFAVYCAETQGVYLIPIDDVLSRTGAYLRVDPPRNGQNKGIRWARDYEVARIRCLAATRA